LENKGYSEEDWEEILESKVGSDRFDKPQQGWCYLTTASKEFKLTTEQLREGIRRGIIQCRRVENPHRPTGPKATVVERNQIEEHLVELQALPKRGAEKSSSTQQSPPLEANNRKRGLPQVMRTRKPAVVISEDKVTVPYRDEAVH
jgi:hypothetical protein